VNRGRKGVVAVSLLLLDVQQPGCRAGQSEQSKFEGEKIIALRNLLMAKHASLMLA
jgi:hypothetical protein